jgi:hypothetical protein
MPLDTMAKKPPYLRTCAPSRTRTCGLVLGGKPDPGQTTPTVVL